MGGQRHRVCVVQGASRGIGLELARLLAARGDSVFATCRSPSQAEELRALRAANPDTVAVLQLDVSEPSTIAAAVEELSRHPLATRGGSHAAVDLLLNTAGVLQDLSCGLMPERGLARVDADAVAKSFAVNALGPLLVAKEMAPLLRRAASQRTDRQPDQPGAAAVFYSARVGSIGDNGRGGWHAYRGSKAALNQFVRCMALELSKHKVCCLAFHPGTVDTDLTRAFARARAEYTVQTAEAAAQGHLELFDSLGMKDSGRFLDWRREEVPW